MTTLTNASHLVDFSYNPDFAAVGEDMFRTTQRQQDLAYLEDVRTMMSETRSDNIPALLGDLNYLNYHTTFRVHGSLNSSSTVFAVDLLGKTFTIDGEYFTLNDPTPEVWDSEFELIKLEDIPLTIGEEIELAYY